VVAAVPHDTRRTGRIEASVDKKPAVGDSLTVVRSRALLLWVPEEAAQVARGLLEEATARTVTLGPDGLVPDDLGRADGVVIVAEWARLAGEPGRVLAWEEALGGAPLAVVILAAPDRVPAALAALRERAADDVLPWPSPPEMLAYRIERAFRALAEEAGRQGLRAELVRQVIDFKEFNRVALALSAERDVNRLLDLILTKCREVTTADAGSLYLVEERAPDAGAWESGSDRILRFVVAQNDSKSLDLKAASLPLNRASIAGYVALTRTPLNLKDVHHLPDDVEFTASTAARLDKALNYRTISMLVIPLVDYTNEIIGVVQVINKKRSPQIRLETAAVAEAEVLPFGARDQEMVTSLASLAAVALNKALLIDRIERLLEGIVRASVTAIEQRDPATRGHSDRVARLTVGLAEAVDRLDTGEYQNVRFTRDELKELEYASLLHDIGKVGVREHVLLKAKKLLDPELAVIRARFDFIKRTVQHDYVRRMMDALMRLGPDAARPQLKQLEEELERRLETLEAEFDLVAKVNEPTVLRSEVSANLRQVAQQRYPYFDGSDRPYLTEPEVRSLFVPKGSLTDDERLEIESHVTHSFRFLMQIPWTKELRRVPLIAYSHHERLDGSGYPRRVREVEIPLQARMMAISDIYDALTAADRPYKPAVSVERALDILSAEARAARIDHQLLDLFVEARVFATHGATRPGHEP
jgi:HD-GYP domain-containing protein (c-di-GMP phosphodiesterase class II)